MSTSNEPALTRRLAAEALGTGLLVAVIVGSGIAAAKLSPGDVGLQLLENALVTAAGLAVIILLVGPVSGAHLNPVVSIADWWIGRRRGSGLRLAHLGAYAAAWGLARSGRATLSAPAVGAYIGAAYWFTASTSFANPAVTIGRMFSDTFAGIAPSSVPPFIAAQLVGAAVGVLVVLYLYPEVQVATDKSVASGVTS